MNFWDWITGRGQQQKAATTQQSQVDNAFVESLFRFYNNSMPVNNMRQGNPQTIIENGYASNGDVYAVVNLILKAACAVPLILYREKTGSQGAKLARMKQKRLEKEGIRVPIHILTKDVTEVEAHPLLDLYDSPNPMQTFYEFKESVLGFLLCVGNGYIFKNILENGPNKGLPTELWSMFPQTVEILPDQLYPGIVRGYKLNTYGTEVGYNEVLHLKYWNPLYQQNDMQWLYGLSPLYVLRSRIQQGNTSDETMWKILKNSGLEGIFTPERYEDGIDGLTPEQGRAIEKKLNGKYAKGDRVGVVTVPMKYQQIGLNPVDMALLEAKLFTKRDLCDAYGVNSALLNDPDNKTFNNLSEARESLYTNAAIPANFRFEQAINRGVCKLYAGKGEKLYFEHDYSVVPELQKDTTELYKAIEMVTFLTPDEKRDIFNYAEIGLPEAQRLYMDSGLQPLGEPTSEADAAIKQLRKEGVNDYV